MVKLVYNGETEIKLIECEEFINILKQYSVASKESLSGDKEDTTSKKKYEEQNNDSNDTPENVIKKLENEIKSQKQDILKFQKTFTQMKVDIYKLRAENKVCQLNYVKPDINYNESNELKKNENSKKINSETQTEATYIEI